MANKRTQWLVTTIFILLQTLILIVPGVSLTKKGNLTILHTNDIQSHLDGFARLATKIKEIKQAKARENEPVLLLDSGDFLIGTLYHLLATTLSSELTLINKLGYDAITLGNHEFEWGPQTLARIINIARTNGGGLTVAIVASNIRFNFFDSRDDALEKLYHADVIRPYLVKDLSNGLKVGIIGLLGDDAEKLAPLVAPIKFNHNREFIQDVVNMLRSKNVDLVILLSHSGLEEDKKLAKLIKGIDIIIAGHCETVLAQPISVNNTLIVEAGSRTKYLGKLELCVNEGEVSLRDYQLIPLENNIFKDDTIQRIIDEYKSVVDKEILNPIALTFNTPLAETGFDLIGKTELICETNLGDLVTDSIRFAIERYQPEDSVDFAFQPTGFIREGIIAGIVKTSDAFSVVPLGIGPDMKPGYPLVSFYLNAQEIKRILEISIYLASSRGSEYLLQVSGLKFWYNPLQPILKKVTRVERWDSTRSRYIPFDTQDKRTLYKVGINFLLVDIVTLVKRHLPWLAIIPKDKDGHPISLDNPADRKKILIDKNPASSDIQELKEWQAFIEYLLHFPDLNGDSIPDIPDRYIQSQGRINRLPEEVLNYQAQKSPLIGVGAALVFPSLGHVYAKNWYPRGLKFLLLELGSIILASRESTRILGLLTLAAFKIWECGDVYKVVIDYNKQLAKKYHIEFSLNKGKTSVGLSWRL